MQQQQSTKVNKPYEIKRNKRGRQRGGQPRKDSPSKRVNFDNERESKFRRYEQDAKTAGCNDISWYSRDPELLKAASNMGFSTYTGEQIEQTGFSVPGVMAIYFDCIIPEYPANKASNMDYSFVVHANSRTTRYDAPDLFILKLAGIQVFMAIAHAVRAYGVMKRYPGLNKFKPQALINAMGFNFADLQANLANMWFDINDMINQSRQIWIPADMPLMKRWFWLVSELYMDGESAKDQTYLFVPRRFLQFSETGEPNGSSLNVYSAWNPSGTNPPLFKWEDYKVMVQTLLDSLLNSQDRGIIFGDILKAYGEDKIFAMNSISADYTVEAVYNTEVLTQIENLDYVDPTNSMLQVAQASGRGVYPVFGAGTKPTNAPAYGKLWKILNFHQNQAPTPEQIMIATRLSSLGYRNEQSKTEGKIITSPAVYCTEIVTGTVIFQYQYQSSETLLRIDLVPSIAGTATTNTSALAVMRLLAFDWAPWRYYVNSGTFDDAVVTNLGSEPALAIGDYANWAIVNMKDLSKLHNAAALSLFNVE